MTNYVWCWHNCGAFIPSGFSDNRVKCCYKLKIMNMLYRWKNITTNYVWCWHNTGMVSLVSQKVLQPLSVLSVLKLLECTENWSGTIWQENTKWSLSICSRSSWSASFFLDGILDVVEIIPCLYTITFW